MKRSKKTNELGDGNVLGSLNRFGPSLQLAPVGVDPLGSQQREDPAISWRRRGGADGDK
jgi:hypothetical protein